MYFSVLGFALGLTVGYLLWYGFKEKADLLSLHCDTLQYCLDMCAETVEKLQSSPTSMREEE